MPLEKEGKYMETKKATIRREANNTYLTLEGNGQSFDITLTDDNPNNVKSVFNNLLKDLKKGAFRYELNDENADLYHHICLEYLLQLNVELKTIFDELTNYKLVDDK